MLEAGLHGGPIWAYAVMLLGAGLTAFYTLRMTWLVFFGAERTLLFLKQLYHGMGPGGVELVEATLGRLRENPNPPGN